MEIKASGRSALILATGLFVCFAAPLPATAAGTDSATSASKADTTKQNSRHSKRDAHRKSGKAVEKSSETTPDTKKAADTGVADAGGLTPAAIPATIANANAQLTADVPADTASAMSAKANTLLAAADRPADGQPAADGQVVSSDQLNDVDRVLQQGAPATQASPSSTQTVAMAPVRAASPSPTLASNESSTWDQTSLIGKIFIGFGALLTMASAARMFMA